MYTVKIRDIKSPEVDYDEVEIPIEPKPKLKIKRKNELGKADSIYKILSVQVEHQSDTIVVMCEVIEQTQIKNEESNV